jgi:hypothetical protein
MPGVVMLPKGPHCLWPQDSRRPAHEGILVMAINPIELAAAASKLLVALEKVFADVTPDVSNPANLLNFQADVQTYQDITASIADVKTLIADLK